MNLYLEKFAEGLKEAMEDHQKSHNVFDIKGGSMFPHSENQRLWTYSRTPKGLHLADGQHTYTFQGDLSPEAETMLEKHPDVPLPDMYKDSISRGKAQVHRSSPGSIYFTLQEGKRNPTYTLRHSSDNKWVAVPKSTKAKKQMAEEPFIANVNLEHVKEGMTRELNNYFSETNGGSQGFFKSALVGEALQGLANLPARMALTPAGIGGPITHFDDQTPGVSEGLGRAVTNAGVAGLAGAGIGAGYHQLKRHLYNTPEENAQEDAEGDKLTKRMLMGGGVMAGANLAGRQLFPGAINNPDWRMFG